MTGVPEGVHSPTLLALLTDSRALGFVGPGPLEPHVQHAQGFAALGRHLSPGGPVRLVDLGSGGGLPGLVVAVEWPEVSLTLLEANGRRASFLRQAADRLALSARVSVLEDRAERAGREDDLRGSFDGALARSFGRPAVVAECAAPLLKVGGWLLVSEPPAPGREEEADRWPAAALRQVGLEPAETLRQTFDYRLLRQVEACPDRYPRRDGVPAKKPLF